MNNDPNMPTSKPRAKTSHHLYTNPVKYAETGHVIQASNLKRRVSRKLPALRDQDPGKYPGLVFEPAAQLYLKYGAPQQPPIYSAQSPHTAEAAEASNQRSTGPAMRTLQLENMFRPIVAGVGTM
jgi:hypothetical protein